MISVVRSWPLAVVSTWLVFFGVRQVPPSSQPGSDYLMVICINLVDFSWAVVLLRLVWLPVQSGSIDSRGIIFPLSLCMRLACPRSSSLQLAPRRVSQALSQTPAPLLSAAPRLLRLRPSSRYG